jgi:hypothetical protein
MKKLILIVILGAGVWYGVQWFLGKAKDTAGGVHEHVNPGEKALKESP